MRPGAPFWTEYVPTVGVLPSGLPRTRPDDTTARPLPNANASTTPLLITDPLLPCSSIAVPPVPSSTPTVPFGPTVTLRPSLASA